MGVYNPHLPYILGEEWVGIRNEELTFEPTVNTVEQGHRFTLTAPSQVNHARMYVNEIGPNGGNGSIAAVSIYPAGLGDVSGPIRSVDIPLSSVTISGDTPAAIATVVVAGAPTALGALFSQGTDSSVRFAGSLSDFRWVSLLFDINKYAGLIQNKRILNIQLIYTANCTDSLIEEDPEQNFGVANSIFNSFINWTPNPHVFLSTAPFLGRIVANPDDGTVLDMGELNFHFSGQVPTANINQFPDRMNFSWTELTRMAGLSSPFVYVMMGMAGSNTTSESVSLYYVALRITYCDEQRVAYGATAIGSNFSNAYGKSIVPGAFIINLRSPTTMAANPVLAAGSYDVVVSSATLPLPLQPVPGFPKINALRQLYEIPPHPAIKTQIPFPLDTAIGRTFEEKTTTILPQLSLHTTGGTLIEPHVYGRQAVAQVYGTVTAIQDIYDLPVGSSLPFPQVRYYARRFGDTTQSLLLSSPTIPASTVSITPAQFDALDTNIVDGWKEVTLRFATPPSMGTLPGGPAWTWSAAGETVANRWEILGVSAPAITAMPSDPFQLVPYANQLAQATYGGGASALAGAFVAAGVAAHGINASVVPSMPAGIQRGDLLLIHAAIRNSPNGNPNAPAGYTQLLNSSNMRAFGKIYDGVETAPTVTFDSGVANATTSAQMAAFRNVTLSVVTSANQLNGSAANIATPAITSTLENNTLVLYFGWREQDWTSVATLAGATEIGEPSTGLGDNQGIVWDYAFQAAAGAVSSTSFVVTGGIAGISRGAVLVLRHADQGAEVELTWMPQGVGSVTTTTPTADPSSDGVLIFSQDPATITGFAISLQSQAVTGFAECSHGPCCVPSAISYHRVTWSPTTMPITGFGAYELQRRDPIGAEWETIMLATSPTITGFNDFEARVGVLSSYQIRQTNALDFAGLWSITGTGTVTAPGVTLPSCGTNKRGVLIFTTNEVQDGSSNLAYAMTWDDAVTEDFDFPEAGTIDIQRHHDRDFQVAFHGSERGGESFSRRLLLANAAIALPRLGNTHSLRDLAWEDLSYVCVRDDIGDRWLSTIIVPHSETRRNRRLYNANITVIEVTDTPSPVDP